MCPLCIALAALIGALGGLAGAAALLRKPFRRLPDAPAPQPEG
jgi:hypothetical protein